MICSCNGSECRTGENEAAGPVHSNHGIHICIPPLPYTLFTPHTSHLPQVVPLPLNDQAGSGDDGDGDSPATEGLLPVQALVEAAVRVAGAGPMQPVEVRELPCRCYAAALGESER